MDVSQLPEPLRHELLRYLGATSQDRARLIGELTGRNPGIAELSSILEADERATDSIRDPATHKPGDVAVTCEMTNVEPDKCG